MPAEVPAQLLQKFAHRTSNLEKEAVTLINKKEYKDMLKRLQKGVIDLDDRTLVDTLYSIGKLHRY